MIKNNKKDIMDTNKKIKKLQITVWILGIYVFMSLVIQLYNMFA